MSNKKKLSLPSKVKVGGFTYGVRENSIVIIGGSINYAGSCDHNEKEIEILSSIKDDVKLNVFLHELLHAVFFEAGYQEHTEEMIVRLSNVLHQVVVDNNWKVGGVSGG